MIKKSTNAIITTPYWSAATAEVKNLRSLIFAALTISAGIVMNTFFIPVGENLRISLAFLPLSLGAMIFGPILGIFAGAAYDLLGFMLHPTGTFFPGYTLSAMLEFFIYGFFLYKKKPTIIRLFLARFTVNYGVHVLLGCVWSSIMFGKGYIYYFVKSLVKNTLMLPLEVIMLITIVQIILPVLIRAGIVPRQKP